MNKRDFKRVINLAEKLLKSGHCHDDGKHGVCTAIMHAQMELMDYDDDIDVIVSYIFKRLFTIKTYNDYWLGGRTIDNIPHRIEVLRLFETIMIDTKTYQSINENNVY